MQAYFCPRCGTVDGLERAIPMPLGVQLEIWCIACKKPRELANIKYNLKETEG